MNYIHVLKKIRLIIYIFLSIFLILLYSWIATWDIFLGYLGLVVLIAAIVLWNTKGLKYLNFSLIVLLLLSIILFPQSLKIYNQKTSEYMSEIDSGKDLNFKEKTSIYGLNLFMCIFAYPLYPEVSKESFYLMFKTEKEQRVFEDDFFMNSQRIKNGFKNKIARVAWYQSEYVFGHSESRYGLALNPCILKMKEFDTYTQYSVEVNVSYPVKSRTVLLKSPVEIVVEEGLFNYLQKVKWLHPYTAIWNTTIKK